MSSYNSINDKNSYNRAKNVLEPYVKVAFEELGYIVRDATVIEDMENHSDLYIMGKNNVYKQPFGFDVKGNEKSQRFSNRVTFTKISKTGKLFIPNSNNFFAFVDECNYEIYIINQVKFFKLTENFILHKSTKNNSQFIWVEKQFLRDNAIRIIKPSNKLYSMLNN